MFSPFLPLFSRSTKSEWGPARQAKGCFLRGSQEISLFDRFLGGDRKLGGCRGGDKAEARRAASAQGQSPSRRAREKKGRLKGNVAEEIKEDRARK